MPGPGADAMGQARAVVGLDMERPWPIIGQNADHRVEHDASPGPDGCSADGDSVGEPLPGESQVWKAPARNDREIRFEQPGMRRMDRRTGKRPVNFGTQFGFGVFSRKEQMHGNNRD